MFKLLIFLSQISFAQINQGTVDVNVLGGSLSLSGPSSVTQSGTWSVGLSTGSNVIGSISNSSFGISGSLPAGSNALGSITNTVFGATQSGTWNINSITNPVAVTGTFFQATQPVSGSVSISGTPNVSVTSSVLPTSASTSALQTAGNALLTSIDSTLAQPLTVSGELMTSFSPDTTNVTTGTFQPIKFDARGRVETHSTVLTDEGSFRDQFSGGTLDPSWTVAAGAGSTSVATSSLVIGSGTAAGNVSVSHAADYGPLIVSSKFAISQRIANQTIFWGTRNTISAPSIRSEFEFSGTDNTSVNCVTRSSADANDIQTTTFVLPKNQTTATALTYQIEVTSSEISFIVNDTVVCEHRDAVQGAYANLILSYLITNAATVANTNVTADWANFFNVNRLEVASAFRGEKIEIANIELKDSNLRTYRAVSVAQGLANNATDVFTITGSATQTIKIKKVFIQGTQTTAAFANLVLLKRSTANTGGTSVNLVEVPVDSDSVAATATALSYAANPTLGTLVGNIETSKLIVPTATVGVSAFDARPTPFLFGNGNSQPVVLRGTSEVFSINLNAQTFTGGSFNIWVEWTEEAL